MDDVNDVNDVDDVVDQRARNRHERGEGVISAAIAVLIMAFLGAAMWVGFNTIWDDAEENIGEQVDEIGEDTSAGGDAGE